MKNAVIFSLFFAFASCKNATPSALVAHTNTLKDSLEAEPKPREFTEPTEMVDMPYKRVKKGKAVILSKILAKYKIENDKDGEANPENKAYYESKKYLNAVAEQIKEYTFDNDWELTFERFNGQIYMHYNTRYLVKAIPLNLVEAYIE